MIGESLFSKIANDFSKISNALFLPSLNTSWLEASTVGSTSLFRNCVGGTLSAGTLTEAYKIDCERKTQSESSRIVKTDEGWEERDGWFLSPVECLQQSWSWPT